MLDANVTVRTSGAVVSTRTDIKESSKVCLSDETSAFPDGSLNDVIYVDLWEECIEPV